MKTLLIAVAALTIAAGCSESSNEQRADQAAERPAEREDIDTVFDPMVSNIDKAKQVEQQVLEQKKKMDEAISRAE